MAGRPAKSKSQSRQQRQESSFADIINSNQPKDIKSFSNMRIEYKHKTQNQKALIDSIKNNEITICSGAAGTGKTYLTCAVALELLKSGNYDKIVIAKSVQTIKDEEIGFLKGTIQEKMEPTIQSFIQNFNKLIGKGFTKMLMDNELIEVMPLAYIRGCNRDNEIVIIDETQNISITNIRTVLTRIGENTKMIFLGDEEQIDMKNKKETSLVFIKEKLKDIDGIGVVQFEIADIIRNPIIKKIEEIFRTEDK
jgi:phosphate starvation-inducible PhoH-like protein